MGSTESWVMASFYMHWETDGAAHLRKPQEGDVEMPWRRICADHPAQAKKFLETLQKEFDKHKGY